MTATRKARVPMAEQIRLINECRQSGMTDADWCRENGIAVSTFYNWVSRCRKTAADQIPAPNYGHCVIPRSKQDVCSHWHCSGSTYGTAHSITDAPNEP